MADEEEKDPDESLKLLTDLSSDVASAYSRFQKKAAAGQIDLPAALDELFSLFVDSQSLNASMHESHFEWMGGVDEELASLTGAESTLTLEDAAKLKTLLLVLADNLRPPANEEDSVPQILKGRVAEMIDWIDSLGEPEEEDEEEDDSDEE